jgi:hypothetical protein
MSSPPASPAVYRSAVASLVIQLLVAATIAVAFGLRLPAKDSSDLRLILALELSSQLIEFLYYTLVVCRFRAILTWTRYLDWVLSTPIMLTSTILFFRYRAGEELYPATFRMPMFYACLSLNMLMLAFGFALEFSAAIGKPLALTGGGAALVGSFAAMATFLPSGDDLSLGLYVFTFSVWALYGVAAALDYVRKNVSYNLLDLVSKNVYGLLLFGYSLSLVS